MVFDENSSTEISETIKKLGREFVVQAIGTVRERSSKNKNIPTGEIEIDVNGLKVLSPSAVPPFTIEDESDGGDDIRMKYRSYNFV